jgi:hypothetical protein
VYDGNELKWGFCKELCADGVRVSRRQTRKGADPITEARSIERRWGQ